MELKEAFEQAVTESKALPRKPDNEQLLELYALYKQATEGDTNDQTPKPQLFDFIGKAKYDAWSAKKGLSADDAMNAYIALVAQLQRILL
ncbi:MAG: acyl-CoA-binding protein [Chitinophagaceae bacterium]